MIGDPSPCIFMVADKEGMPIRQSLHTTILNEYAASSNHISHFLEGQKEILNENGKDYSDGIMMAYEGNMEAHSMKKKNESEKQADSAR